MNNDESKSKFEIVSISPASQVCSKVTKPMDRVQIDFYFDFICPWCYIGYVRLKRLEEELKDEIQLEITPKTFLLYPNLPLEGIGREQMVSRKVPGMGKALKMAASLEDLKIDYSKILRLPNTTKAHYILNRLEPTLKLGFVEQLFHSYFQDGMDISDPIFLGKLENDIRITEAGSSLTTQNVVDNYRASSILNNEIPDDLSVVPSIDLEGKLLVQGLQSFQTWERLIWKAISINKKNKA